MRTSLFLAATVLTSVSLTRDVPRRAAATPPCVTATTACERWIIFGGGPARSMVYSTYSLDTPNPAMTRALVMVHGAGRNADHYFETAVAAGFLDGALDNTMIVSPRLIASPDKPQPNEVMWPNGSNSWRAGGMSPSNPTISSFDFIDEILRKLANKKNFPNLTKVVVAGHSAGGQVATRYEMVNKVHGKLGVEITYVVANPSSYAWPAAVRPLHTGNGDPVGADKEALGPNGEKVNSNFTYGPFDASKAPNYNRWPAGLDGRTDGYAAGISEEQLKKQLVERPTTYLLGQVDVLPLGGFDSSATAMAQGPTRRARGEAFYKYITDNLGAKHNIMIVPECGHNDRCIFTTNTVFPLIFPR